ncbi:MAG: peptidylprolyl isomerase [Deltaproteobacteria bacterium]|nr:MAG: peptidylprolyl isomerase [Deltaproteobacteria bacterium]
MTPLTDLIVRNEERLLGQILSLAEASGYFRFVPGTPTEWRATLRGLSGSLLQAFRSNPSPPSLTADNVGGGDGLSAFGVVEARKRRREGMPLGIFLGLVKVFRQAYLDLVRTAGLQREEEEGLLRYIERFFDRNEVASCVSWTAESISGRVAELQEKHDELFRVHQLVATGKQEWVGTVDCVDDMLFLADPHRRIRRCNRTFREFIGRTYTEILGQPFDRLLSEAGVDVALSLGKPVECFHERTRKWLVLSHYPFEEASASGARGTIVTIHDSTEMKKTAEELTRKNLRLNEALAALKRSQAKVLHQEKMASIGQLAAGVAHEINNPIGFINSNLSTLGKYLSRIGGFLAIQSECIAAGAPPEQVESVRQQQASLKIDYIVKDLEDLIRESMEGAERVRSIVADLKSFSRVDESEYRQADLNECLRSTINIAWHEIKHKATLRKELGEIPRTRCYPQQMNQAFMNLLVNAAHAIEHQGVITVRSWEEDGYVCVSVADTGRGIPEENLDRIFEPFFTTKEVGKGTGLGLSITCDIVKKHNGEITVRSDPGTGTVFTVRIPVVEEA